MRSSSCSGFLLLAMAFGYVDSSSASGIVVDAASEPVYWECNGCTILGVEGTASIHGIGTHFVYDLPGNHFYRNACEPGGGGTIACNAIEQRSGNPYLTFVNYRNLWLNNGQSEAFHPAYHLDIPSSAPRNPAGGPVDDGNINAYDTLSYPHSEHEVELALTSYFGTSVGIMEPKIDGVVYDYENGSMVVTVTFHDRSTRKYKLSRNSDGAFFPLTNTAVDSSGNPLPESHPSNYQVYTFYGNPRGYDVTNMTMLLSPPSLPQDVGGCTSQRWDGEQLTCVHPF